MSMYGYDVSFHDYGFSDLAITNSIYGNSISPMAAAVDYEDEIYVRRRPPTRRSPPPSSPPKHRHDGTSPLPLGMDWSLPPRIWEGRNSVWPHDSNKRWSYCVTIPSWTIVPSASGSDTVFFNVQVGIQSPEGITTTRGVLRRFNDFLKLHFELRKEFPKRSLPLTPARRLMMRSKTRLEERRCGLEGWMEKLLSDIDVSRTALVAIFLELEAAARQSCCELTRNESVPSGQFSSNSRISVLETRESSKETLDEAISTESEGSKHMKLEIEELVRKCTELELRLTTEQDARAYFELTKTSVIQQNEMLLKELDDAKGQIEILRKQQDEVELKSKSKSQSDIIDFSKCLEEKGELELLCECELLRKKLQECSLNFLVEDKLVADTSLSEAIDLLEASDAQIALLSAQAQLLNDNLRMVLRDNLTENAKLRKQVNAAVRHVLSTADNTPKEEADVDDTTKTGANELLD